MERQRERPPRDEGEKAQEAQAEAGPQGLRCPFCRGELNEGDLASACATCGTPHHVTCFAEHRGCSVHACGSTHGRSMRVGDADATQEFKPLTCMHCRTPIPLEAMVARCSCWWAYHAGCYEDVRRCLNQACAGKQVEMMQHTEAVATQLERQAWAGGIGGGFFLLCAVVLLGPLLSGGKDVVGLATTMAFLVLVAAFFFLLGRNQRRRARAARNTPITPRAGAPEAGGVETKQAKGSQSPPEPS